MVPVVDHKAREVVSLLLHQLSHPSASTNGGVMPGNGGGGSGVADMSSLLLRFTLDSIGAIAFGKDLGSLRYDPTHSPLQCGTFALDSHSPLTQCPFFSKAST